MKINRKTTRKIAWQVNPFPNKLREKLRVKAIQNKTTVASIIEELLHDFHKHKTVRYQFTGKADKYKFDGVLQIQKIPCDLRDKFVKNCKTWLRRDVYRVLTDIIANYVE